MSPFHEKDGQFAIGEGNANSASHYGDEFVTARRLSKAGDGISTGNDFSGVADH